MHPSEDVEGTRRDVTLGATPRRSAFDSLALQVKDLDGRSSSGT